MDEQSLISGFVIGAFVTLVLLAISFASFKIYLALKEKQEHSLVQALNGHLQLRQIVNELLARADEADHDGRYLESNLKAEYDKRLSRLCTELVALGDSLQDIESSIQSKKASQAKKKLLSSIHKATELSQDIKIIRRQIRFRK